MVNLVNFLEGGQGEHVNVPKTLLVFRKNKKKGHFHSVLDFLPSSPYTFTMFTKFTWARRLGETMKAKRKGTRNEHKTVQLLEAAGYSCTRAAGSLGLFDVVTIGSSDIVLVQVKTRDWPGYVT